MIMFLDDILVLTPSVEINSKSSRTLVYSWVSCDVINFSGGQL